jgi:hypothetical protein
MHFGLSVPAARRMAGTREVKAPTPGGAICVSRWRRNALLGHTKTLMRMLKFAPVVRFLPTLSFCYLHR